jgi:hypothetical protein
MIPSNWDEITVRQWLEINDVLINDELSTFSKTLELLLLLTESDEWEEMPSSEIYKLMPSLYFIYYKPSNNFKIEFDKWKLKPFSKFTLAEWIDLEKYILEKKYENIIALSYRKVKTDEWGNIEYEPYLFNCNERSLQFLDYSINDVFGVIESAIKYRDNILNSFREIFESIEEEDFEATDEEKQFMSDAEIQELKQQIKKDNEKKYYSWQKLLDEISNGNWSYIESILNLPVVFVFGMMMMKRKYA